MTRLLLTAVLLGAASVAVTQEPLAGPIPAVAIDSAAIDEAVIDDAAQLPSLANVTPEIWLYMQQMQRHDDPQMAVRRKAEERAAQRTHRIAARKWFGLSNSRPTANPIPVMATYSPHWAGNDSDPQRFSGVGPAVIRVESE